MLMDRTFVHTKKFDSQWGAIGCSDDDLSELQKAISENPRKYPVIPNTGGVRKIRAPLEGRGKSAGARVLFVDFPGRNTTGLLYAYPKGEKEDIDDDEKKILKMMVSQIKSNWENQK